MKIRVIVLLCLLSVFFGCFSPLAIAETPPAGQVQQSNQTLYVDGTAIVLSDIYNIDGYNYFKLRDIAYLLKDTGSKFSIAYDGTLRQAVATAGGDYVPAGNELSSGGDMSAYCQPSTQTMIFNGKNSTAFVYNIGGSNYFKLRDLAEPFNFFVEYNESTRSIILTSSVSQPVTSAELTLYMTKGVALADKLYLVALKTNLLILTEATNTAEDIYSDARGISDQLQDIVGEMDNVRLNYLPAGNATAIALNNSLNSFYSDVSSSLIAALTYLAEPTTGNLSDYNNTLPVVENSYARIIKDIAQYISVQDAKSALLAYEPGSSGGGATPQTPPGGGSTQPPVTGNESEQQALYEMELALIEARYDVQIQALVIAREKAYQDARVLAEQDIERRGLYDSPYGQGLIEQAAADAAAPYDTQIAALEAARDSEIQQLKIRYNR